MKFMVLNALRVITAIILFSGAILPQSVLACACGCGVFEVGTSSMLPTHPGGMAFVEYDYQNQTRNWSGNSAASAEDNDDKRIHSNFFTLGYQYLFNRAWGVMAELPYTNRYFKTADEDTGNISGYNHSAVGDIRLKGIYSGLSDDMSSGLTFGVRLPTGDYTYQNFDPDVEIGTGSTDLLAGGYHLGTIGGGWGWVMNAEADIPVLHYGGYRPGDEIDAAAGVYFSRWRIGPVKIAPLAELIGSHRWSDTGTLSDAPNTGYSRLLIAPGVEFDTARVRVYADVGLPLVQYTTGDQLVASQYYKLNMGYRF